MAGDYKIFIPGLCLIFLTYSNPYVMAIWGGMLHGFNFALPALALATLLAPAVLGRRGLAARALWHAWCWLAGTGLCVLLAGMVVFGRDGKIASYAALVLSVATACCWLQKRQPQAVLARAAAREPMRPRLR